MIGRILALDVGSVRIGLAVSDALGITAQGLDTYTRINDEKEDINNLISIIKNNNAVALVVGLPLNQYGEIGPQAQKIIDFVKLLHKSINLPISFVDERLTTSISEKILISANMDRHKRKKYVDKIAAVTILQTYMEMNDVAKQRQKSINDFI